MEQARSNIDIGGPCMIRASAKNYLRVASVTNPEQYDLLLKLLSSSAGTDGCGDPFQSGPAGIRPYRRV